MAGSMAAQRKGSAAVPGHQTAPHCGLDWNTNKAVLIILGGSP